jgi:hypothetical protein
MHPKSTADTHAGQPPLDLVLERLPNGELGWLRPAAAEPVDEPRYGLTDTGRRALAMDALFGRSPTVAQLYRQFRATYGNEGGSTAA